MRDFQNIIDNVSNIEDLDNVTILKTLKAFEKYITKNSKQGPKGDTGPQGPQGVRGPIGETGQQGVQGVQGPKGDIGATGPIGPQGPQGVQGVQGMQGEKGASGNDFTIKGFVSSTASLPELTANDVGTAYLVGTSTPRQVYLWGYNEQGVLTWSNQGYLQGPAGPQGIQGVQGIQGPTGATGPQGETGPQGPQGPQGNQGIQGVQGIQGPEGPEGPQGPIGEGFNFMGAWVSDNEYFKNDVVTYNGSSYVLITDTLVGSTTTPDIDTTNWSVMCQGASGDFVQLTMPLAELKAYIWDNKEKIEFIEVTFNAQVTLTGYGIVTGTNSTSINSNLSSNVSSGSKFRFRYSALTSALLGKKATFECGDYSLSFEYSFGSVGSPTFRAPYTVAVGSPVTQITKGDVSKQLVTDSEVTFVVYTRLVFDIWKKL